MMMTMLSISMMNMIAHCSYETTNYSQSYSFVAVKYVGEAKPFSDTFCWCQKTSVCCRCMLPHYPGSNSRSTGNA